MTDRPQPQPAIGSRGVMSMAVSALDMRSFSAGRLAAAGLAGILAAALVARGTSAELGPDLSRFLPVIDLVLAAIVAAALVLRPWPGLLLWTVSDPVLNLVRAQARLGQLQLIVTTIFALALLAGWLFEERERRAARRATVGRAAGEPSIAGESLPAARFATRRWRTTIGLCWLTFAAVAVFGVASGAQLGLAGITVSLHGLIEPAAIAAIVVSLRPTRQQLLALALAIGAGLALASFYAIGQTIRTSHSVSEAVSQRDNLAHLIYFNVGIFGDLLAMTLPLLLAILLARRVTGLPRAARVGVGIAFVLCAAGLYLTFSKSAWIGAAAALVLVVLLSVRTWRARAAVVVVALVASAAIVPYPLYVMRAVGVDPSWYTNLVSNVQGQRVNSWDPTTSAGEISVTERIRSTRAALRMVVDHPLLGVGPNGFTAAYAGPYHDQGAVTALTHAHNLLPGVAAEYGLPMMLLVALALLAAFLACIRAYRRDGPLGRALAVGLFCAIGAFFVVTTLFGLDFYRAYRVMDSDVVIAALLVGAAVALGFASPDPEPASAAGWPVSDDGVAPAVATAR